MSESRPSVVVIFAAALELPAAQRAAYLAEACAGDERLRQQVEALLRSHDEAGTFMEQPGVSSPPGELPPAPAAGIQLDPSASSDPSAAPDEIIGQTIGRYKLLERIGEGGCGVVYVAEQLEPVRRRVALKLIKLGMDTKAVVARFEAERQALALMEHPNIARVFDAGTSATGRPYFVMELVPGVRIMDFCDQHALTTKERLELFIKVCQAIQHAHQKGIIHRDLKPANILVTRHDGVPMPPIPKNADQVLPGSRRELFTLLAGLPRSRLPAEA